jgi:NADH-quinone oxidoreductase subunit E
VRGAQETLSRLEVMLNLKPGQTDSRQQFTLETVHCLGCCALAPVVQVDDQYHHDPSRKKLERIVESFEKQEELSCRD